MDVDDDNAQARGLKEMNDLMEGINNHYAWLGSDRRPESFKRRSEMKSFIKLPEGTERSSYNRTGQISILIGAFFEYNAPVDPDLWSKGLVERTHFTPEGTVTSTPLHHLYEVTERNTDNATVSMSTLKQFRRRITETERFRRQISDREYYKMTLCTIEFPTFRYAADFVRMAWPNISLEEILKCSEKKIIKAGPNSNFLESAFYYDFTSRSSPSLLFMAIPYLGWEPPDYGSQENKGRESFEGRSQRPSQELSGGSSTILSPLEKKFERLTSYDLTNGKETPWKSTLSLFEYHFPFRQGLDTNDIFAKRGISDSLDMYHKAVAVYSLTFILLDEILIIFRAGNDQQSELNILNPCCPTPEFTSNIERIMQSQKDELIKSFRDRISDIDLIVHTKFAEHQKELFDLHASLRIELISITRVVETQIEALNKLQMCLGRNDISRNQLLEERKEFKKCFEDFLVEIKDSQKHMMELAQIETMRQQKIAAESSIRMTEERISQEAAATERFRMRQEEMHARNLEYVRRALEFRQETTLVFTIVTAIFLPLNFFTSYYGMNTVDIRSTNSTQGDFWAVCGPISVVVSIIALTIGCRKQIAHTALYQWVKARAVFLISRIPRILAILTTAMAF